MRRLWQPGGCGAMKKRIDNNNNNNNNNIY
jgi:hypothetical protein